MRESIDMFSKGIFQKSGALHKNSKPNGFEKTFAFHFTNQMDRKRVIARGPWSFDNFLLALEEPKGLSDSDIAKMQFNCVEFWIQIHKAPLMCMNKEMVIFLGKQIGVLKAIDLGESGDCWGEYLRVTNL
ncbi:hypothetical protein Dsin_006566 [Dipteronia sinensis]|uniref:DUF4283 domain-containing protein n=1 Tax=Dipteronia sinensis TaxID=43782 RepID=A0AAE0EG09_9ROSI|nr:hypothetical protein Dsin_006566 [Dipteronia sinensis]